MNRLISRTIAGILLLLPLTALAEGVVYVQSLKAQLLSSPDFGAAAVAEARRGDALRVIESRERWCKVRLGGASGWIPRLVIGERAPLPRATALDSRSDTALQDNARRRASAATTAGAARGLTYEDRMRASQAGVANYAALEQMETFSVSEQEALNFVAEGVGQ